MTKCKSCGSELKNTPGRRQKEFCNSTCRSKFWYAVNKAPKKEAIVNVVDLSKPNKGVKDLSKKPVETNYSVDTRPKTLDELKKLCPAELTDFDRSEWIANERQKFGI